MKKMKNAYIRFFILIVSLMVAFKMLNGETNIFTMIKEFFELINPLITAIFISYILYIPVSSLEKLMKKSKKTYFKNKSRGLSVLIVYLTIGILVYFAFNWFIPFMYKYTVELINNIPEYINRTEEFLINNPIKIFGNDINLAGELEKLRNTNIFSQNIFDINNGDVISQALKVFSVFEVIINGIMAIIFSIYMLLYKEEIYNFFRKVAIAFTSKRTTNKIGMYLKKGNTIFFKYITVQILDGIIVGIIMSILFIILKVKYAIPLGFLIGLSNLIPFFGAIFGIGLAGILTIFTGGIGQAIFILIVAIIIQQIDANILNPILIGNSLEINKILVLASVIVFGAYFGPIGMFLAVPITKILTLIVNDMLDYRIRKNNVKRKLVIRSKNRINKLNKNIKINIEANKASIEREKV